MVVGWVKVVGLTWFVLVSMGFGDDVEEVVGEEEEEVVVEEGGVPSAGSGKFNFSRTWGDSTWEAAVYKRCRRYV